MARAAYRFDPATESWTVLAPAPVPFIAAAGPAIPVGGKQLLFLPGDDGEFFERRMELAGRHPGFPRRSYIHDTAADAWLAAGEIKPGVRTPAILMPRSSDRQKPPAEAGGVTRGDQR